MLGVLLYTKFLKGFIMDRLELYDKWRFMEALDSERVVPYGIPREIYIAMLMADYFDMTTSLFPEHIDYAIRNRIPNRK